MALNSTECKFLKGLLKELGERFSNDGCNDFEMPNTPANRDFMVKMIRSQITDWWGESKEEIQDSIEEIRTCESKHLLTNNGFIVDYLLHRIEEIND